MKKNNKLADFCLKNNFKQIDFNSNNAWGFGGAYGNRYTNEKYTLTIATACYRHLSPEKFITLKTNNETIFDLSNTTQNQEKIMNYLTQNI